MDGYVVCDKCNEREKFFLEKGKVHISIKCESCGSWIKFIPKRDFNYLSNIQKLRVVDLNDPNRPTQLRIDIDNNSISKEEIFCKKCNVSSNDISDFYVEVGNKHSSLKCKNCGSWIKFISKDKFEEYKDIYNIEIVKKDVKKKI